MGKAALTPIASKRRRLQVPRCVRYICAEIMASSGLGYWEGVNR